MKALFTPFKVGLVVVGAFMAFLYMYGQVKGGIEDDKAGYRVSAIFRDVSGLAPKSRVVIAGINVGQIDQIELAGDQARVWIKVNIPLKSDARIARRSAGLLGEFYIQLTPGYTGTPLKDGDEIKNVDYDTEMSDVINEVKAITSNVSEITASLNRVVSGVDGEQRLVDTLNAVRDTAQEINRTVQTNTPKIDAMLDNVLHATANAEQFTREFQRDARFVLSDARKVSSDAAAITQSVRDIIGKNRPGVEGSFEGVNGAVARLQGALDKLDGTLDKTRSIATKIDDGKGTLGRLVNDDRLVNSVNDLVTETSGFVRRITRLQVGVGLQAEWYFKQSAAKTYLELRLQPRPDKFYSFQLIDDPRGRTNFVRRVISSSDSETDPLVSEQITTTEDQFKLSLQFAKRMWFAQGRVGIIESTGGIGVDFLFLDDDLEFNTDLFDLDGATNPRVRARAMYRFFSHIYISGGIDDILNDDLRDWFIGAGVRFTDDDLIAILATAPSGAP